MNDDPRKRLTAAERVVLYQAAQQIAAGTEDAIALQPEHLRSAIRKAVRELLA